MEEIKSPEIEENSSNYTSSKYPTPDGAPADVVIFTITSEEIVPQELPKTDVKVLMIKRKKWPYKGCWALPGGFSNPSEKMIQAAKRELKEETKVAGLHIELSDIYAGNDSNGKPRDPRGWIISTAYFALVNEKYLADREADDDAEEAELIPLKDLLAMSKGNQDGDSEENKNTLAFDHNDIILDAYKKVQDKMLRTDIAKEFLSKQFTLSELYRVIQTVVPTFDEKMPNFRRKILKRGIIREVEGKTSNKYSKVHAQLYEFTGEVPTISIYS